MTQSTLWGWRSLPVWLRYLVVILLVLGIFFRFYHLGRKVFWTDETLTLQRVAGYTRSEVTDTLFTGNVVSWEAVQQYQHPPLEKGWDDTMMALTSTAEHTPLYFLLVRLWGDGFGYSIASIRGLSAVINVLGFPCMLWLGWELFQSAAASWIALGLFAISPLQVLYAQEARPYSLWAVCTLLASAALLRAMRTQTVRSWSLYAVSLMLGFYTQLLFAAVAIAHAVYVGWMEPIVEKRRLGATVRSFLLAVGAALLAFSPWMALIVAKLNRIQDTTASLAKAHSLSFLIDKWFQGLNRGLLGDDLNSFNIALVLLTLIALFALWRSASRRIWLFIGLLTIVPFLALALPDLLLGGERSIRIRYLIPSFMGIQLAFAYLFAQALQGTRWPQRLTRLLFGVFIVICVTACTASAQASIWWNKGISRSAYYLDVPNFINYGDRPLVISDSRASEIFALSYRVDPKVSFLLLRKTDTPRIPDGYDGVFLINPSDNLKETVRQQGYRLTLVYEDPDALAGEAERLWQVKRP